jgi:hypothetical protein
VSLLFYDRQGQPIGVQEWGRLFEDDDYRTVAAHWVRGWKVTTIWLGINDPLRCLYQGGPPVAIFETMIFAPGDVRLSGDDDLHLYQERYPTEAAAQAGHDRALAAVVDRLGADAAADITGPLIDGSSDSEWDGSLPEWAASPDSET